MINLIGIIDEMVCGLKFEEEVLCMFKEFLEGIILVVYNVFFDMGFLNISYGKYGIFEVVNFVIDILELFRFLYLYFKSYCLNILLKKFGVNLE